MATVLSESPFAHLEKENSITFMQDVADAIQYFDEIKQAYDNDMRELVALSQRVDDLAARIPEKSGT